MKIRVLLMFPVLLFPFNPAWGLGDGVRTKVIYGEDGRRDLFEVADPRIVRLADSTVSILHRGDVTVDAAGKTAKLSVIHYGQSMGLCTTERFYSQTMAGFCSGTLVGPDLIMTAGHCVDSLGDCAEKKFVFGYSLVQPGEAPTSMPAGEVYGCKEVVGKVFTEDGPDWALVRLDRAVPNHKPLKIDRGAGVKNGTPLFVIGHPSDLPTKVADGARVRDASPATYFVSNLDTFGGNSGSAVFNAETLLIEGIVSRGEEDFDYSGRCVVSKHCPDDGCRGEDSTKISVLADRIPDGGAAAVRERARASRSLSSLESAFQAPN